MKVGTKSVLYGAHCFLIHPFFVAAAWIKLYGVPLDPRIWIVFFVHDLGYCGKPNMDGPEGETHVEFGAKIMHLFDWKYEKIKQIYPGKEMVAKARSEGWKPYRIIGPFVFYSRRSTKWRDLSLYHSRYYAKKNNAMPSQLCFADKLSFALTPRWIYLPMVNATGEIHEYLKNAEKNGKEWVPVSGQIKWHNQLKEYMTKWVDEHKDGSVDTWTNSDRHSTDESGVWK